MNYFFIFICLTFLAVCNSEKEVTEEQTKFARLLVSKKILNDFLIEDQEIKIEYGVFNVGESSAINIKISDTNLPPQYFAFINGTNSINFPKLAPNGKEFRILIFKSRLGTWGRFNFTSADVFYQTEVTKTIQHGFSSEPGINYIFSREEYEKRYSLHLIDWAIFVLLTFPSLLIPFLLWYKSKSKYTKILTLYKKENKN